MDFKNLIFTRVETIPPDKARAILEGTGKESITLLDVRQPREYQRGHIPKAILIPLSQLRVRIEELSRNHPIIVYCASGVRSAAAARMLKASGFRNVYNLGGGIKAWSGRTASGGEGFGLELFTGKGDFKEVFIAAYSMERNLGRFYSTLADAVDNPQSKALLERLAGFEERHKALLLKEWGGSLTSNQVEVLSDRIEGALFLDQQLKRFLSQEPAQGTILETAMGIEAQAMDLYWRLSRKSGPHQEFFAFMTEEEAGHLRALERELEKLLGKGGTDG